MLVCEHSASHCRTLGPHSITGRSVSGYFAQCESAEDHAGLWQRSCLHVGADAGDDAGLMPFSGVPWPSAASLVPLTEPNFSGNLSFAVFLLSDKDGNCKSLILLSASFFCIQGFI